MPACQEVSPQYDPLSISFLISSYCWKADQNPGGRQYRLPFPINIKIYYSSVVGPELNAKVKFNGISLYDVQKPKCTSTFCLGKISTNKCLRTPKISVKCLKLEETWPRLRKTSQISTDWSARSASFWRQDTEFIFQPIFATFFTIILENASEPHPFAKIKVIALSPK